MIKTLTDLIVEQQKKFFDVWMYVLNDEIQSLAQAFGERFFLQNAIAEYEKLQHSGAKALLNKIIYLHMTTYVKENLSWYMINGFINREAASKIEDKWTQAVKNMVPYTNDAVGALGVNQIEWLHGPLARDYVAFNA